MAQYQGSYNESEIPQVRPMNEFAAGLIFFAALMMLLLGSFHMVAGIAALLNDEFYQIRPGFGLEMGVSGWGWTQIVGGIVLMITGVLLLTGSTFARILSIVFTAIAAFWNFYSIPYYPLWSVVMLTGCLLILWSLIAHGREFSEAIKE